MTPNVTMYVIVILCVEVSTRLPPTSSMTSSVVDEAAEDSWDVTSPSKG